MASLFAIEIIAVCRPLATVGLYFTEKVRFAQAEIVAPDGWAETVNAGSPLMETIGEPVKFNDELPKFSMVNTCIKLEEIMTEPKSVSSKIAGKASPFKIELPFPRILMSFVKPVIKTLSK